MLVCGTFLLTLHTCFAPPLPRGLSVPSRRPLRVSVETAMPFRSRDCVPQVRKEDAAHVPFIRKSETRPAYSAGKHTRPMTATLVILGLTALFFAIGKLRSDLVAMCALLALLFLNILTPTEALAGFSSNVVIMMVGLFIVGGAVFQTGLAKIIGARIVGLAHGRPLLLSVLVMLVTGCIGAFVSNTGTVALMLPIVTSLAAGSKQISSRQLLMPMAFASSLGLFTLISTPPNLIINDMLVEGGYEELRFFSFAPIGAVCLLVGILVLLPLSKWLLGGSSEKAGKKNRHKTLADLAREYDLNQDLRRYHVSRRSPAVGKTLADLDIQQRYGLNVLEVRREKARQAGVVTNVEQRVATAATVISADDYIYVSGDKAQAERFAHDYSLVHERTAKGVHLDFYDIGIAEIVLQNGSRMVKRQLKDAGFREKYNLNVVGIRRKGEYLTPKNLPRKSGAVSFPDIELHSGDVLLVQGSWKNIARLNAEDDKWIVIGEPLEAASRVTLDYKAPLAAAIMLAMIAAMVFDFIPIAPVTAVLAAAVLMVLGGCFRTVEDAYKTINWESIVLIAAMMPMSTALQKTGASELISSTMVGWLGDMGPLVLLAGVYFTTSILTLFVSNTATAVLMAPIAMASAVAMDASPYPFLFAVAVSASMCFASPFSTPPNALVMRAGSYTFMDYVKVGLPLQLIMGVVMLLVLPLLFPF